MTPDRYEREFHLPHGHATSFAGGPLAALRNKNPELTRYETPSRACTSPAPPRSPAPACGAPAAATPHFGSSAARCRRYGLIMSAYTLPDLRLRPGRAGAAPQRSDRRAAPRQAPRRLCVRRQRRPRPAGRDTGRRRLSARWSVWRRRWRSTSVVTCCTRCTGPNLSPDGGGQPDGPLGALRSTSTSFVRHVPGALRPGDDAGPGFGLGHLRRTSRVGRRLIIEQLEVHHQNTTLGCRAAARDRRLGARLLPAVQQPPRRLRRRDLERRPLGRRGRRFAAATG